MRGGPVSLFYNPSMSETAPWIIHTDGAARGNPGPAAYAYTIARAGHPVVEASDRIGDTTNNIAEYTALLRALEHAHRLGGQRLVIHSDSELMVKQMKGEYKVKHPGLVPLFEHAKALARRFQNVAFQHIRREDNKNADRLCNLALDGPSKQPPSAGSSQATRNRAAKKGKAVDPARAEAIRDQAVDCLRTAAAAWARGNADSPPPDAVWEQLWDILRQEGVV